MGDEEKKKGLPKDQEHSEVPEGTPTDQHLFPVINGVENQGLSDSSATETGIHGEGDQSKQKVKRTPKKSTISPALELKVISQHSRLRVFSDWETLAAMLTVADGLAQLKSRLELLEGEWHQFNLTHDSLALTCTKEFLESSYVKDGVYDLVYRSYINAKGKLIALINSIPVPAVAPTVIHSTRAPTHLPALAIPKFDGRYENWPEFRDSFTSMVINAQELAPVQRLQYLKSCLQGQAALSLASVQMCDDQFVPAWNQLKERYDNPRLLIGAQLDKLLNMHALTSRSSEQLNYLLNTVSEVINALNALGVQLNSDMNPLLTQLIISKLDSHNRELWENKMGASTEYPSLKVLNDFLVSRARAQERVEQASKPPRSSGKPASYSAVAVSNSHSSETKSPATNSSTALKKPPKKVFPPAQYPCDLCKGDHFIVRCTQFLGLTKAQRTQVVVEKRLCENCFGHHLPDTCNSKFTCRVCEQKHHTMIHPGLNSTQKPSSSAAKGTQ
ncbi:uncharacterized protein LOC130667328 [Microplitis mediator]|uniref:uncharacterized protein LOC130667328 n=1 Tax=Microplitis mediator TaxID=375433 RepID=UPI0025574CE8|nr:uncharacterized protein LOC130667328 [Microplitis mediator]